MCVFERVSEKLAISIAMKKQAGCEIEAIGMNYIIYPQKRYSNPFKTMFNRDNPQQQQQQQQQQDQEVFRGAAPGGGTDHKPAESRRGMHVLKDINCVAKPWEILAVVGPSGAGKSTLLEILAGRLTPQMSSIYVNRKPIEKAHFKKISGYVAQKDLLFPLLTVEETLMFSAKLRLSHIPPSHLESRVKSLIQELGLGHVAKARVGDDRFRGISGGERRRVSIGVDVIHDPRVLILDEPTSGLDSSSALQIIDMLKIMAETRGRTIILSIHQPGFRIVKLFNSVLLLANGSVLHHGTVDQLQTQLRVTGLQLPLHVNIVDFAIDSIETLQLASDQEQVLPQIAPAAAAPQQSNNMRLGEGDHHIHQASAGTNKSSTGKKLTLQQLFQQSKQVVDHEAEEYCIDDHHDLLNIPYCGGGYANSRLRETVILTHRFSKNIYRTKELFACRTIQMLIVGLVLGSIFYNLKDDLVGSQERVGLFAFILTFLLSCTTEALPIFLQEREILMKETSCGSYRVSSYVIANGLVFLPFLLILALLFSLPLYWLVGLNPSIAAFMYFLLLIWLIFYTANSVVVCFSALVPNFIVGNSVISGVMGSFFLFSGYFISKNGMPKFWVFMHYISLFKYPFEGFLINEFSGWGAGSKCLDYMFGACVVTGEDILKEEGFGEESRWRNVVIMVCFILFYRFMSYIILRCRCSQRN